jgi:hypothetical protein
MISHAVSNMQSVNQPIRRTKRERVESADQVSLCGSQITDVIDAEIRALYSSQLGVHRKQANQFQQQHIQQHQQQPPRKVYCGSDGARRQIAQPWDFSFADLGTPTTNGSLNKLAFSFDDAVPPPTALQAGTLSADPTLFPEVSEFDFGQQTQQPNDIIRDDVYAYLSPRFDDYRPSGLWLGSGHETDCSSSTNSGASTPASSSTHLSYSNAKKSEKKEVRRKKWSKEEDRLLAKAVAQHGEEDFAVVAIKVKSRNTTQCRMRWMHAIRPVSKNTRVIYSY